MSIKETLLWQVLASFILTCCWFLWAILFDPQSLAPILLSALAGGVCAFIPAACYARLISRVQASLWALVIGEIGKIFLTIALFVLFFRLFDRVRWLPLLTTYALVLQTYWLAFVRK